MQPSQAQAHPWLGRTPIPWHGYRTRSQGECQPLIARVRPASDMSLYFGSSTGGMHLCNVIHYAILLTPRSASSQAGVMVLQLAVILECLLTAFYSFVLSHTHHTEWLYVLHRIYRPLVMHLDMTSGRPVRSETLFAAKNFHFQARPKARLSPTSLACRVCLSRGTQRASAHPAVGLSLSRLLHCPSMLTAIRRQALP